MNNLKASSTQGAKVVSIVSTKGGVGKTTTAANLSALIADAGKKVLLIDLDTQPTLSSYFNLADEKQQGTYELIGVNNRSLNEIVSKTTIPNLDIIISNDHQNHLNTLLADSSAGELRLFNLLPYIRPSYDLIVLDTQGARSNTLKMCIIASDITVSPIPPEMLAAREFSRGTIQLISELIEAYSLLNVKIPTVQLFINRADFSSNDSKIIANTLRESFQTNRIVDVLNTIVPDIATYRKAATLQQPAHRQEPRKPSGRVSPSALETMKSLACEIFPEWTQDIELLTPDVITGLIHRDQNTEVA